MSDARGLTPEAPEPLDKEGGFWSCRWAALSQPRRTLVMDRVLVVDDSSSMRSHVRGVLEKDGDPGGAFEVFEASSGFEALRLLPRERYDAVILDINLPDIDGLDLIRFVRQSEHHRQVALVILSGQSSARSRDRAAALGADAFLAKPPTEEALREALARSLRGRRVRLSERP